MIAFLQSGRFGNQLFQYAALRTAADPGEALVLLGFDELRAMFDNLDARFPVKARSRLFRLLGGRMRPHLDRFMGWQPLIGTIGEDDRSRIRTQRGMLHRVRFATTSYFQWETSFDPAVVASLRMRPQHVTAAQAFVRDVAPAGRPLAFVHVRRGDYLYYPAPGTPAALDAAWYRDRMDTLRSRLHDPFFIVCSDDGAFVQREFGAEPDVHVSTRNAFEDFVIMCSCTAGVLSASSYSWWAAWFGARAGHGPFLAPEFWIGHARREWYPPGIRSSFLEYA